MWIWYIAFVLLEVHDLYDGRTANAVVFSPRTPHHNHIFNDYNDADSADELDMPSLVSESESEDSSSESEDDMPMSKL